MGKKYSYWALIAHFSFSVWFSFFLCQFMSRTVIITKTVHFFTPYYTQVSLAVTFVLSHKLSVLIYGKIMFKQTCLLFNLRVQYCFVFLCFLYYSKPFTFVLKRLLYVQMKSCLLFTAVMLNWWVELK